MTTARRTTPMVDTRIIVVGLLVLLLGVLGVLARRDGPPELNPRQTPSLRATIPPDEIRPPDLPAVVLVHGLGRGPISLAPLGRGLVEDGFRVVNFGYPSWTGEADSLVALLADSVDACCGDALEQVNFVTHSLGGILVRMYLQDYSPGHKGRVVMLSPPNAGSEIIDLVQSVPGLRGLLGPTGSTLGTDSTSLPNQLGPVTFPLGVITGDRSLNPIYSWLIPGPDDGKVSVERARIDGAEQLLVAPFSHSFIMNREPVLNEITTFLTTGSFSEEALEAWAYGLPEAGTRIPDSTPGSEAVDADSVQVRPDSAGVAH